MRVYTILGTRPEIIRLSRIIPKLDNLCDHTIIHTTQNHDYRLNGLFFQELKLRLPDIYLGAKGMSLGGQLAEMFQKIETLFINDRPDKVVILGDTNSGLCSIIAERMGIPVYHLESANRCFDKRVPEEVNRKLIDAISSYNLCYTPTAKENLIKEGGDRKKIFQCGNPINEVLNYYRKEIDGSKILQALNLNKGQYFLTTFHRAETVDVKLKLEEILLGLNKIANKYSLPILCSVHPRTRDKLKKTKIKLNPKIKLLEPFGFFDFVKLEKFSRLILSDSGTVMEEACILGIPSVILREVTERPEIVETGSTMLSGVDSNQILMATQIMLNCSRDWRIPEGYGDLNVSDKVIHYILGANQ